MLVNIVFLLYAEILINSIQKGAFEKYLHRVKKARSRPRKFCQRVSNSDNISFKLMRGERIQIPLKESGPSSAR